MLLGAQVDATAKSTFRKYYLQIYQVTCIRSYVENRSCATDLITTCIYNFCDEMKNETGQNSYWAYAL